jgi:hypothetical protein
MSQARLRDQDLRLRIRNIARLREYIWHLSFERLRTISLQSFHTEFERNPSTHLPTMNSTRIRLKHREESVMVTRQGTTAT